MSASIRISRKVAMALLEILESKLPLDIPVDRAALAELHRALAPKQRKPIAKAYKAQKAAKRQSKKEETKEIRAAVMKRADGACESQMCRLSFTALRQPELDHFFGRRGSQSERTCWLLCRGCHRDKTQSKPSAATWLNLYTAHCEKYDYTREAQMARNRLFFVRARGAA